MKKLTLGFLVASAAVALATVSIPARDAGSEHAQVLAVACCDDPAPVCWPIPCDPTEPPPGGGRDQKSVRP